MRTSPLKTAGLLVLALCSVRCGGGGGGGSPAPAPVFFISKIVPAADATGVALDAHVFLTLSKPVDTTTIRPDSVQVGILGEGAVLGLVGIVAGSANKLLELAPVTLLGASKEYGVVVSADLRSVDGDPIDGVRQFFFRTVASGGGGGGVVLPPASRLQPTNQRLRQGRRSHTATLLFDDRVLLCGGYTAGTTVTDKAETFEGAGQSFTLLAGRMKAPRASHAAARLLDGRVLLCGGYREVSVGSLASSATAEIFDPVTNTFTSTAPMSTERVDHAATLLPDGRVLVTGGSRLLGQTIVDLASAEIFSPTTGTWSPAPFDLVHTHATHAVVDLSDGRFLVVGGSDTDLRPEIYTTSTGTFTAFAEASLDTGRFGAAVARWSDGDVAIVGGEAQGQVLDFRRATTFLLNTGSPTTVPRAYATASALSGSRLLVAGGLDYTNGNQVLPTCDLIVEGGLSGSTTYATDVRFPTGMAMHTATVLSDGRILFAGGINATVGQPELDGAYLYTP